MQTNHIGHRHFETKNLDANNEISNHQQLKKQRHSKKIEQAVENLMEQISEAIAKKGTHCSHPKLREKAIASEDNTEIISAEKSLSEGNTINNNLNDPINDKDGMTQLIESQASKIDLNTMLSADSNGNINEEQLQSAIVQYLLEQQKPELGKSYLQELSNSISQGYQFEDSVKVALSALVKKGLITQEQAEKINGSSFRAAQLDNNLNALYDSKGGKDDNTIAVMKLEDAIKTALENINNINSGKLIAESRNLDAPSNRKGTNNTSIVSSFSNSSNGFLWKPVSDSNGNLVILFPSNLTGQISSARIYSKEPTSYENLIEEGRYSGDSNGARSHFRFSKPGSSYPDGVLVVAQLKNGQEVTFKIGDSASRNT